MNHKEILEIVKQEVELCNINLWDNMWYDESMSTYFQTKDTLPKSHVTQIESGATKLCLFFDNIQEYVVKIPYVGAIYFNNDSFDEVQEEYTNAGECVNSPCDSWDYCMTEAALFQEAKKLGIDKCFAGTYYIGSIDDFPIYVSSKVPNYVSGKSSPKAKELGKKIIDSKPQELGDLTSDSLGLFIDNYGYDIAKRMFDFLKEHKIKDMHSGNLGFTQDNHIKIIDYCSYNESIYF